MTPDNAEALLDHFTGGGTASSELAATAGEASATTG